MTKKQTKERKLNKRYSNYNIKSSSKPQHNKGYYADVGINDPMNQYVMPHEVDKYTDLLHFVVPYQLDKDSKDKLYVTFTKTDQNYILYWLHRMENELCHKSIAYQKIFNAFLQPINHFSNSTHEPIGHLNNTLTMIAGLRINFLRNGEEARFLKSQLPMIEHVFWMAHFYLIEYKWSDVNNGQSILSSQDIGFIKKSGKPNPPLFPIHFIKYNKTLASEWFEDENDNE